MRLSLFLQTLVLASTISITRPSFATSENLPLKGQLTLWSRTACMDAEQPAACSVPSPLPVSFAVDAAVKLPLGKPGPHIVYDKLFSNGTWRVRLTLIWVEMASATSYLVTQSSLSQTDVGEIASCSRYDKLDDTIVLPIGACGGRWGEKIVGVSFSKSN